MRHYQGFVEQPSISRKFPHISVVDREFALDLMAHLILQRYTHDVTHDVATTYINSTLIARLAVSSFAVTTYGEHVAL